MPRYSTLLPLLILIATAPLVTPAQPLNDQTILAAIQQGLPSDVSPQIVSSELGCHVIVLDQAAQTDRTLRLALYAVTGEGETVSLERVDANPALPGCQTYQLNLEEGTSPPAFVAVRLRNSQGDSSPRTQSLMMPAERSAEETVVIFNPALIAEGHPFHLE